MPKKSKIDKKDDDSSQIIVITPDQLAKLGLTKKINNVMETNNTMQAEENLKSKKSARTKSNKKIEQESIIDKNVDKISENNEEMESTSNISRRTTSRKRKLPKKYEDNANEKKTKLDLLENDFPDVMCSVEITEEYKPTPKKKGRPRKTVDTSIKEDNTPKVPKKVGRPKRDRSIIINSDISLTNDDSQENDISEEGNDILQGEHDISQSENENNASKIGGRRKRNQNAILKKDYVVSDSEEDKEIPKITKTITPKTPKTKIDRGKKLQADSIMGQCLQQYIDRLKKIINGEETLPILDIKRENQKVEFVQPVQCAICKKTIEKRLFYGHKTLHNNICWIEGEQPLDLDDILVVNNVMMHYSKKKPLRCDFCGCKKKSLVGFVTHYAICLKTPEEIENMKVKCEYCDSKQIISSMPTHHKLIHKDLLTPKYNKPKKIEESPILEETNNEINTGRKAASKAKLMLQELKNKGELISGENEIEKRDYLVENYQLATSKKLLKHAGKQIKLNNSIKCKYECSETFNEVDEFMQHLAICPHSFQNNFTCILCFIPFKTFDLAEMHMDNSHDKNYIMEDVNESDEEYEKIKITNTNLTKPKTFNKLTACGFLLDVKYQMNKKHTYLKAFKWTLEFCKLNFTEQNLHFKYFNTQNIILKPELICGYLPKLTTSINIAVKDVKNLDFRDKCANLVLRRFKLFEISKEAGNTSLIFCGGPVEVMAWLPTDFKVDNCNQILAVGIGLSPNNFFKNSNFIFELKEKVRKKGLIQFWSFGDLNKSVPDIKLNFCLAHDFGNLTDMVFCPSGCYKINKNSDNFDNNKLGLLAVASCDSNVYILPIFDSKNKFLKAMPTAKLNLDVANEKNVFNEVFNYPTRISWTKSKGHNYIAVGYNTGLIALFNLNGENHVLQEDGMFFIKPYYVFHGHKQMVTFLSLNPLNNCHRWLASGSIDKCYKYWDLEDPTNNYTNFTRDPITSGVWNHNWIGVALTFDDTTMRNATNLHNHRITNEKLSLMYSSSPTLTSDCSNWSNIFLHGNCVGEISGSHHTQLFTIDHKRTANRKFVAGYTKLVYNSDLKLHSYCQTWNEDTQPRTYEEMNEKYGLVLCETPFNHPQNFLAQNYAQMLNIQDAKPNIYPIDAINKICINPNKQSYNYFAVGYQNGFVKLKKLPFNQYNI